MTIEHAYILLIPVTGLLCLVVLWAYIEVILNVEGKRLHDQRSRERDR